MALADFLRFFRRRFRTYPTVVSAQTLQAFEVVKHHNLLVIGGPKYNFAAQTLLDDLDYRLPYQFRRLRPRESTPYKAVDPELKKFVGTTPESPVYESDPQHDQDFGCVVMATNPYNEQRKILVVAGLSTLATVGASEWLQRTQPALWVRARRDGFEAIVSCRTSGITRASHVTRAFLAYLPPERDGG